MYGGQPPPGPSGHGSPQAYYQRPPAPQMAHHHMQQHVRPPYSGSPRPPIPHHPQIGRPQHPPVHPHPQMHPNNQAQHSGAPKGVPVPMKVRKVGDRLQKIKNFTKNKFSYLQNSQF